MSFFHPLLNLLLIDHDTRFRAVSYMDLGSGFLSLENFKTALSNIQRQPKLECIKGLKDLITFSLIFMYCLCGTYSSKHLLLTSLSFLESLSLFVIQFLLTLGHLSGLGNVRTFEDVERPIDMLKTLLARTLFEWSRIWGLTHCSSLSDFLISISLSL